jgi:MtN3 and saliva related transmembrane protein|tara:strand:- start:1276 stop:1617 length:342 start_codon:yes stop_codon:yes gene_type:complete
MSNSNLGMQHFHLRKRIHQKKEKYPHPKKSKRIVDKAIYFVAIIGPLMNIPQLMKIWVDKNATGISIISWVGFALTAFVWLIYGILHKEKPIILANIMYIILQIGIIVGALIY